MRLWDGNYGLPLPPFLSNLLEFSTLVVQLLIISTLVVQLLKVRKPFFIGYLYFTTLYKNSQTFYKHFTKKIKKIYVKTLDILRVKTGEHMFTLLL